MYEQVNDSNYGSESDNYFAAISSDTANLLEPLLQKFILEKLQQIQWLILVGSVASKLKL